MTITERLQKLDPSLTIHSESEWSGGAEAKEYSAFNSGGIECETGEFLYSLIRLTKPENVLETGTHLGVGASYMGLALQDNQKGKLDTYEFLPEIYSQAVNRINRMKLSDRVTVYLKDVANVQPQNNYQLIFLDTEPQTRFAELIKFYPYLDEGGFIFIHDLHRHMHQIPNEEHGFAWPYGTIPDDMYSLIGTKKLIPFHFSTPRGLTGFYKRNKTDYEWLL